MSRAIMNQRIPMHSSAPFANDHNPCENWFNDWAQKTGSQPILKSDALKILLGRYRDRDISQPKDSSARKFSASIALLLAATSKCKEAWSSCPSRASSLVRAWNKFRTMQEKDVFEQDWFAICFNASSDPKRHPRSEKFARSLTRLENQQFDLFGLDAYFERDKQMTTDHTAHQVTTHQPKPSLEHARPSTCVQNLDTRPAEHLDQSHKTKNLNHAPQDHLSISDLKIVHSTAALVAPDSSIRLGESETHIPTRIKVLVDENATLLAQFDEIGRELDRLEHQKMLREQAASREETKTRRRAYADILGKLTRALGSVSQDDAGWMELTQELQELGIEPIGRVGQSVELAQEYEKQFDLGARTELAPGSAVEVLSNGWSWEDQTLVRARVRPVRGGTP